ncbi:MAG: hypothetical protein IT454_00930 [Planctomycetes bacterium]|nr:hypothetical protein [Planctomycetota bacterium]
MKSSDLNALIKSKPHWRVNVRPERFDADLITTREQCAALIRKCKLSLRGWDYPYLHGDQFEFGQTWVAGKFDGESRAEYWRMYQSGQFIHLFVVQEASDDRLIEKLRELTRAHLGYIDGIDWTSVPGFIHVVNVIHRVTEILEFSSRLCQAGIVQGRMSVSIEIRGIDGFVLTTDFNRAWSHYHAATQDSLSRTWSGESQVLVAESRQIALGICQWFFESFGWTDASPDVIRSDQQRLLGKL